MAHEMEQEPEVPIMDERWVEVQKKTFTKWANSQLTKGGAELRISDLVDEVYTGLEMGQLVGILFPDVEKRKYNKKGKMRIHHLENCQKVIEHAKDAGVKLKGTSAEHFVDKDKKMLLGFVWCLILHYQVSGISEEDLSAKDGLLLWCKKKTKGYKDSETGAPVKCDNFTTSWQDGMTLAALIHKHRPDLIDFDSMHPATARENLQTCFDVAESELGIPKLLDVEDMVDVPKPDERSVVTYISEFFHVFAGSDKAEHASRRVQNFINFMKAVDEMKHDYEARARAVQEWITASDSDLGDRTEMSTYQEAKAKLGEFSEYKTGPKREWLAKKNELGYLFTSIQNKLRANGRSAYVPPEKLSPQEIDEQWLELATSERERYKFCVENLHNVKENLRKLFTERANALMDLINALNQKANNLEGDIDEQIAATDALLEEVAAGETSLDEIRAVDKDMQDANIEENVHCVHTVEDLSFALSQLSQLVKQMHGSLENQKAAAGMKTSVPPELLEEFKETFAFFDKDKTNTLEKHEFKGGLAGLGINTTDAEMDELFPRVSEGNAFISFEQFVNYMVSISEDKDTADQVMESFSIIGGGKEEITEKDMRMAGLDDEQVEWLKGQLQPGSAPDTFTYKAFVETAFN